MPRPARNPDRLVVLLQSQGTVPARHLIEQLRVSPATLSRLLALLDSRVERIGAGRSSRYALRREVRGLGTEWPVYRIDRDGRPGVWGHLRALHGGFRFVPSAVPPPIWMQRDYRDGVFAGLPFFLQDIRPQGYLGRAIARDAASRSGLPEDIRRWNDDDALTYFVAEGYDLSGDMIVGDRALTRAMRSTDEVARSCIPDDQRTSVYPERAASAQRGELVGSSAAGEQPKFLANVARSDGRPTSVLVKFSAAETSPVSERWADLLLCEHLAAETLRHRGVIAATTNLLDGGGRRFLEVERFDRVNAVGRRGLMTLGAMEDAFFESSSTDWAVASGRFESAGWITADEARTLRWIWCFGDLIANSDMHRANASFWFGDQMPCQLAPFYDMLPMLYAPGAQGELGERTFSPRPPVASVVGIWSDAAAAAMEFWTRVVADPRLSESFRVVAQRSQAIVQRQIQRFG